MNTTESVGVLPRIDLREDAFRKYEALISRACQGSFDYDPAEMDRPVTAHTFCARFRDAIRGFRLYGYRSHIVPANYDFRNIRLFELTNGKVRLSNTTEDIAKAGRSAMPHARDQASVLKAISHMDQWRVLGVDPMAEKSGRTKVRVAYDTPEERVWLDSLDGEHDVRLVEQDVAQGVAELRWWPHLA